MPESVPWILPLSFLFVLTLVISVHELGHYWAGRAFNLVIDRFSIGMGKPILKWTDKRGVQWQIGWAPIGGYVRFAGDDNAASIPDQETLDEMKAKILEHNDPSALRRFYHFAPVWQRAIISVAGPVANFILAIALFSLLFGFFGETRTTPRILNVPAGTPAAAAGLQPGDLVKSADGRPIRDLAALNQYVVVRANVPIHFVVDRNGRQLDIVATPRTRQVIDPTGARQKVGLLGYEDLPTRIGAVDPGGPADKAGFQAGDLILTADGKAIKGFEQLSELLQPFANRPVTFTVDRGGSTVTLIGTPVMRELRDSRGVRMRAAMGLANSTLGQEVVREKYNPIGAVGAGARKTWQVFDTTLYYLGRLVRGQVPADQLGSFIGIAKASESVAEQGARDAPNLGIALLGAVVNLLFLSAVLSVSVGFLNLLPIPVLDGGHLVFYAYEAVARRPLAASVQAVGYRLGLALLLGFMLFAVWNDLQRYNVFNFLGGLFS